MPSDTLARMTKHQELTQTLLEMAKTLKPGDQLPSQSELMRRYSVSDRTLLRSLDDLQKAGWIVRRHGVGTFVADRAGRAVPSRETTSAQSNVIGALVMALGPVYQYFVDRLTVMAGESGLSLVCHHAHHEDSFEDALPLEALHPRGFLLFSYYLLPIAQRLRERGHRVVIVGAPPAGVMPEVPCIYNDQDHGGYLATRHLIENGHRRIAYVVPETRYRLEDTLRWQGHQRALDEARRRGHGVQDTLLAREEWLTWRDDPTRCTAFFARPDAPTGLLAWNDDKAVELLHLLYRGGVRVPDDVSLVGYDALPIGETSIPPVTTVDSQIEAQLRSVMQLLTQPQPISRTQAVMVIPTLLSRSSVAAPPPAHSTTPELAKVG